MSWLALFADGGTLIDWKLVAGPVAGATITATAGLLLWWLNRKRPNYLNVREVSSVSLVNITESVRPRIRTTLDDMPIAALSQVELEVTNGSRETLKAADFVVAFLPEAIVHEAEIEGLKASKSIKGHSVEVSVPFINPFRDHKELLRLKILCDGPIEGMTVTGRGEGWSVRQRKFSQEVGHVEWVFPWIAPAVRSIFYSLVVCCIAILTSLMCYLAATLFR